MLVKTPTWSKNTNMGNIFKCPRLQGEVPKSYVLYYC